MLTLKKLLGKKTKNVKISENFFEYLIGSAFLTSHNQFEVFLMPLRPYKISDLYPLRGWSTLENITKLVPTHN